MGAVMKQKNFSKGSIFGFIKQAHPFYKQISAFEEMIHLSPAYSEYLSRQQQGLTTCIHAEVKTKSCEDGRYLERFYYSIQYPEHTLRGGWYAWSLHYSRYDGLTQISEFPNDPKLVHLPLFINSPENRDIEVLRYVPLRRVTFRTPASQEQPSIIGKLKKPNRCQESYRRLVDLAKIADYNACAIPKPKGINIAQSVFYQELVPGVETGLILNRENYRVFLSEIGKLHGHLFSWPILEDKPWGRDGVMKNIWQDLDEIIFYLPQTELVLSKIGNWLKQRKNYLAVISKTFCHGDLSCSQILRHANGWSVVDFDLAGLGDPYQDMAMFLVSLNYDVDFFQGQPEFLPIAYAAYLEGYQHANEDRVDVETFNWYLACAEIYYLSLILKKDRFTTLALDRALVRLQQLTELT